MKIAMFNIYNKDEVEADEQFFVDEYLPGLLSKYLLNNTQKAQFTIGLGDKTDVNNMLPLYRVHYDNGKFIVGFCRYGYDESLTFSRSFSKDRFLRFLTALERQKTLDWKGFGPIIKMEVMGE